MRATKAIIYLDNFRANIEAARRQAGSHPALCVPVKADAYGHGAAVMSGAALEAGAEYLALATVDEGAQLRQAGITAPLFLFSQALPGEMDEIARLELIPFVGDKDAAGLFALSASKTGKRLPVHLKVDTGMGRMGCRPESAARLAAFIAGQKSLRLGGMATHLAVSDSLKDDDIGYTKNQLARFGEAAEAVRAAGLDPGLLHAANSGALCFHPDSYFDIVRPGIFLYGYSPGAGIPGGLESTPVMELRSSIIFIKKVRKGEDISYGRTWTAGGDCLIGTMPVGYADGLPRLLSGRHQVRINGKTYPFVGRICMDQCMVDLGQDETVKRWDEVIIFGPKAETAADMAAKIGSISYEVLCNINRRVPRVYAG
jgi:alanine racemase